MKKAWTSTACLGLVLLSGCGEDPPLPAPPVKQNAELPKSDAAVVLHRAAKRVAEMIPKSPLVAEPLFPPVESWKDIPLPESVEKGLAWLVKVQAEDGGWGQDGGLSGSARAEDKAESTGNDVANTSLTTLALLRAGQAHPNAKHHAAFTRGLNFVVDRVEKAPADGLDLVTPKGTQIQRKLGPSIDTFLASMLLSEAEGTIADKVLNQRVRDALQKVVRKIEKNQGKDGSWNAAGGWAPILGTSLASRSLKTAQGKGVTVDAASLEKVDTWTKGSLYARGNLGGTDHFESKAPAAGFVEAKAELTTATVTLDAGFALPPAAPAAVVALEAPKELSAGEKRKIRTRIIAEEGRFSDRRAASAGVELYDHAQAIEQLSRTDKDREENKVVLKELSANLKTDNVIRGFGSMGGEEFFSYLNVSDSMLRVGGDEWKAWNTKIKQHLEKLQNADGTWAGHHCITGRVACTGAAVLTLISERNPAANGAKK